MKGHQGKKLAASKMPPGTSNFEAQMEDRKNPAFGMAD
jgi:hypothetical protein